MVADPSISILERLPQVIVIPGEPHEQIISELRLKGFQELVIEHQVDTPAIQVFGPECVLNGCPDLVFVLSKATLIHAKASEIFNDGVVNLLERCQILVLMDQLLLFLQALDCQVVCYSLLNNLEFIQDILSLKL